MTVTESLYLRFRPGCSTFNRAFFAAVRRRITPCRALVHFSCLPTNASGTRLNGKAGPEGVEGRMPGIRETNQREGIPRPALAGLRPSSAFRAAGFSDGPSMARRKMADLLSATLTGLVLRAPPPPEGTREASSTASSDTSRHIRQHANALQRPRLLLVREAGGAARH